MAGTIGREARSVGARIAGVVSCVPTTRVGNDQFIDRFGEQGVADVVKMIGVHERRVVKEGQTAQTLCLNAGRHLLEGLEWDAASVDALIFVSQTPDFRLPATACAMQQALGIPAGVIAFDVNLGCSGYPYALWLAMMMIQTGAARRVLLAVGDTISRISDPNDRATALLFGDAGTMTAVEAGTKNDAAAFILGSDGRGVANLIVPNGGFATFDTAADKRFVDKNPDCLFMDGGEIFNFTLKSVPPLVSRIDELHGELGGHDFYLFHQANQFMIKHLVKKAKIDPAKVPINIDTFGNTSSATIPLLMTTKLAETLRERSNTLALLGFGVGYSWAAASLEVGPLKVAEMVEL